MAIHLIIALLWSGAMLAWFLIIRDRFQALEPPTSRSKSGDVFPPVSIIVPARNEEANIEACLRGLLLQAYPRERLRILVVDDHSEDETATIVRRLAEENSNLRLIEAPALPVGWRGKQHACWYGAQQVQADWLCFIDADTQASPDLLKITTKEAETHQLDLLSLHPEQEMRGFWERLLMPVPFMTLMLLLDARRINNRDNSAAMANGQFILIRSEVYFNVDGHQGIRSAVLEDVELAKRVKQSGFNISIRDGAGLIRTRMYRDLKTLWNALARNGSELFGSTLTTLAVINAFFASVFPLGFPIWLAYKLLQDFSWIDAGALGASLFGTLIWYLAHWTAFKELRVPLRYLLLLPVS
ncbi:MAG: glycosyltransferase family 2 protein, partial [Anaerolineales bacterium]